MKEKEPCQYCGTPTGNRKMHEKYCIKSPNKSQSSSAEHSEKQPPQNHTPGGDKLKLGTPDTSTDKTAGETTRNVTSAPADSQSWIDKIMGKITPATDSMEEYKNFFGKMPKFEVRPPGFFKKLLMKKGLTYKAFVFVSKDGNGETAYLPYDAAKQRVVVDKVGYWPIEVKGDVIFLSKEYLLPLAQVPDLSRFQNSANYVWSVYNGGIQEGITIRFDEWLEEQRKDRMFKWICLGIGILALIALAATVYTDGKTISALIEVNNIQSHQLINLTKVH